MDLKTQIKPSAVKMSEDKPPTRRAVDLAAYQTPGTLEALDPDGVVVTPFFRTPYNYDRDAASIEAGLACLDPSLTQQQFVDDADINTIVARFGLTGQMPENLRFPEYGDFTGINNLQDALNVGRAAQEQFMLIPPEVRAEFNNDPAVFLDAVHDERNLPRLRELGLAKALPAIAEKIAQIDAKAVADAQPAPAPEKPPRKEAKEQSSP